MRIVRSSLFAVLVLGSAGVVHAQATQPGTSSRREAMKAGRGNGHGERGLLRGIQLSDAEKTSLKAVHEKYATQFKSLRESFKPQRDELRAARQRGDTAAVKAIWAKSSAQRDQMRALQTQERNDVRGALTAEHQQQFDKNLAQLEQKREQRVGKAGRKGDGASLRPRGARGSR